MFDNYNEPQIYDADGHNITHMLSEFEGEEVYTEQGTPIGIVSLGVIVESYDEEE